MPELNIALNKCERVLSAEDDRRVTECIDTAMSIANEALGKIYTVRAKQVKAGVTPDPFTDGLRCNFIEIERLLTHAYGVFL